MNLSNIIKELKRRNVFKVAIAYAVAGWLIIQVFATIAPQLNFPEWVAPLITVIVLIGFPLALVFAWAFELTPEGIQRSEEIEITESVTASTGKKLNGLIIGVLSVAVLFLLVERIFFAYEGGAENSTVSVKNITDKSIAVLPFDDFNAGGDQEYFADGLTEEILNSLAKTPDLLVASRTSSFQYKDQNTDITEIAKNLGVAHVLEGSVRQSASRYRITAQLIRASDGFHLWSETYDRPKNDIIQIQEDIAFKIATAMQTAMDPVALEEMLRMGTSSVEAFNTYLDALSIMHNQYVENDGHLRKRLDKFEQAARLDTTFSAAYREISNLWLVNASALTRDIKGEGLDAPYDEAIKNFNENISLAIRYAGKEDKLYLEARQAYVNLQFRKALDLYKQYLEIRPTSNEAYSQIIRVANVLGEYETASSFLKNWEKNVLDNAFSNSDLVLGYFFSKNYEKGVLFTEQALRKYPNYRVLIYQAHRLFLWAGEYEKATDLLSSSVPGAFLQTSYMRNACLAGENEKAMEIYENKYNGIPEDGSSWIDLMVLGKEEEAYASLQPLEQDESLYHLSSLLVYPYFDYTRFPRLTAIMERERHKRGPVEEIPFRCNR